MTPISAPRTPPLTRSIARVAVVWALAAGVGLASPGPARADLSPERPRPRKRIDRCTVERQEKKTGRECVACTATWDAKNLCARQLAGMGFERLCKQDRKASWREIWCRTAEAAASTTGDPRASAGAGETRADLEGELTSAGSGAEVEADAPSAGLAPAVPPPADPLDPQAPASSQGCGCVSAAPPAGPWLALALWLVVRRRSPPRA